jgi:hypothetical protein
MAIGRAPAASDDDSDDDDGIGFDPNFTSALAVSAKERASMVPSAGKCQGVNLYTWRIPLPFFQAAASTTARLGALLCTPLL